MICASIREKKMKNVLKKIAEIPADYDLLEIWVNETDDFDFAKITSAWSGELLIKITDISNVSLLKQSNSVVKTSYIDIDINDFAKNDDICKIFKK
jgi:hypothetical protein